MTIHCRTFKLVQFASAVATLSWLAFSSRSRAATTEPVTPTAPQAPAEAGRGERQTEREARCLRDPRVLLGQVTLATCVGADLFFRETFGGNGRTCSSCHPAANNYTLDPRYVAGLPDSDPLFIAEQDPELAGLEVPSLLREHALILVNADGLEDPTNKFVVRSVQHMLGLAVSTLVPTVVHPLSPLHAIDGSLLRIKERLGWSGDGAPGEGRLRDFADGAIVQHATRSLRREEGTDYFLPNDQERDAIAEFSRSIGRLNDVDLNQVRLTDVGAQRGRDSFLGGHARECGFRCHTNAGAIETLLDRFEEDPIVLGHGNVTLGIGTESARLPEVDEAGIMLDAGHGRGARDSDGDGVNDSFGNGAFNAPPLIEAADTGPMFHTNAAETLEDAIRFYSTDDFAQSVVATSPFPNRGASEPIPLDERDVREVGRFLRVLNTSLNLQMSLRRILATEDIVDRFGQGEWEVERGLLSLAAAELEDALEVLGAVRHLHDREQRSLGRALEQLRELSCSKSPTRRLAARLRRIASSVEEANQALGTGLQMQIGQGTLMF